MQNNHRGEIKRQLDRLEDYVGELAKEGKPCEPTTHPGDALGTDGTCWTDEQLCEYAKRLLKNVDNTLRRI